MKELPVLNPAPFRRYPTRLSGQEYADERGVCRDCLSGVCCASEDPIHLTSFDLFRLAAFFDLSPAQFMLAFTQDRFEGEESETKRRLWVEDDRSSTVTFLRRRANLPTSPCIFLKYVRDRDGAPRRVCGVHPARPLACREYYFEHCKRRWTGELAALLAEGYEKVRDGEITEARVDAQLARFSGHDGARASLSESLTYSFWAEMRRALDPERANREGAASYRLADYQDPIDEKLNRVLSARHLRFEEKYGPVPHGEQLMPYDAGLSFVGSAERERLLTIARTPPASDLFGAGDYPHYVAHRAMLPGARTSEFFPAIPDREIAAFLERLPRARLFPRHESAEVRRTTPGEVYAAVLRGYNHLLRFAGYVAEMGNVLEAERPGQVELALAAMLADFETSLHPYLADNPYLRPARQHFAQASVTALEEAFNAATSRADAWALMRALMPLAASFAALPRPLRRRGEALRKRLRQMLTDDSRALAADLANPVAARLAAGKRLDAGRAGQAWRVWSQQLHDARQAAQAGGAIDLVSYYRQAVADLVQIPFRRSYAPHLLRVVQSLACGLSDFNRLACRATPHRETARRLSAHALRLFDWASERGLFPDDDATLAEWVAAVYRGLGLSYNHDPHFGHAVRRLLDRQLPDGSWGTDPTPAQAPESQAEYVTGLYQQTWACLNGLRPVKSDARQPEHAALGLG